MIFSMKKTKERRLKENKAMCRAELEADSLKALIGMRELETRKPIDKKLIPVFEKDMAEFNNRLDGNNLKIEGLKNITINHI